MLLNITGASIGRCAIVPDAFGDADVNQHVLIMRPVNDAVDEYLHVAIISPVVQIAIMIDQGGVQRLAGIFQFTVLLDQGHELSKLTHNPLLLTLRR